MRRRFLLLLALAVALAGCSGAGGGAVEPDGAATPAPLLAGRVLLDRPAAGAQVEMNGATAVTNAGGGFLLPRPRGRALLTASVDGAPFRMALDGPPAHAVVVNAVTNLIALYLETHPDLPLEEADRRVKAFLRIPARVSASHGLEDVAGAPFSHRVFLAAAAQNGGVEAFSRALAAQVDGGPPRAFVSEAAKGFWKDLGLQVAADLGTDLLTGAARGLVGWALSAMNVNVGEAGDLRDLAAQIQQITAQAAQIQDDVLRAFAAGDLQDLTNTLEQQLTSPFDTLNGSYVGQLLAVTPTNVPLPPNPQVSALVQTVLATDLEEFLAVLNDVMQGRNLSPCMPRLVAAQRNAQVGAGQGESLIVLENRSIGVMQSVFDYYASYQTLAYNLLAESVHVADSPAAGIQLARGYTLRLFANLKAQSLLVPVPWKYPVVLDRGGSMWYGTMQGEVDSNGISHYAPMAAQPLYGSGANRTDWTVATVDDADRLFERMQAGVYGPDLAASGPGPALQELGFDVTALDGHTKIWVSGRGPTPARFNLTTGESDTSYGSNDSYPFLWVRAFPSNEDADTARTAGVPTSLEITVTNGLRAVASMSLGTETVEGVDVTDRVVWTSGNPALVEVSNAPGREGTLTWRYEPHPSTVYLYVSDRPIQIVDGQVQPADAVYGRLLLDPPIVLSPPLVSLSVTPKNVDYGTLPTSRQCYATGYYQDGSVRDHTNDAVWSVLNADGTAALPAEEASFSASVPGVLHLKNALTTDRVTLQATFGGKTATTLAGAPVYAPPTRTR